MNLTADNSGHFTKFNPALDQFYEMATSMTYLDDRQQDNKSTIFSELNESAMRYWIVREIAHGGMKKILEVKDVSTNRYIAMAVLSDNVDMNCIEEFLREARVTALLQHPNIMPVYDIGINSLGNPYFTMKLVKKGYNLSGLAKSGRKIRGYEKLSDRLEIFLKICDAVAYAHSKGVIHLDLKPENIQLDDFGQVLVCDWGLSRFIDSSDAKIVPRDPDLSSMDFMNLTLKGEIQGTPGFMAPEQATTEKTCKDERTDVYSLGAILYYLLSFHSPLKSGAVVKMLDDTLSGKLIPLSKWQKQRQIPESMIKVTAKAMNLDPENRYASVTQLQKDIRAYLDGFATTAEEAGLLTIFQLFYQRHKTKCHFILLTLTTIISLFVYSLVSIKNSEARAKASEQKALTNLNELRQTTSEKLKISKVAAIEEHRRARELMLQRNYKAAFMGYKYAIFLDKTNPMFWRGLGWVTFTGQRFQESMNYFNKAIRLVDTQAEKNEHQRFINYIIDAQKLVDPTTKRLSEESILKLRKKYGMSHMLFEHLYYRHKHNLY